MSLEANDLQRIQYRQTYKAWCAIKATTVTHLQREGMPRQSAQAQGRRSPQQEYWNLGNLGSYYVSIRGHNLEPGSTLHGHKRTLRIDLQDSRTGTEDGKRTSASHHDKHPVRQAVHAAVSAVVNCNLSLCNAAG